MAKIDVTTPGLSVTQAAEKGPLITLSNIVYQGAFRVPHTKGNVADDGAPISSQDNGNATGYLGKSTTGRFYMNAHWGGGEGLGEFDIPALVDDADYLIFNTANHTQTYVQGDKMGSLIDIKNDQFGTTMIRPSDGALLYFINEYYGGSNDINNVMVCSDANDIVDAANWSGIFQIDTHEGDVAASNVRAARWVCPIPPEWQADLGGPWLFGSGMGLANKSRQAIGPCAFAFDPDDIGLHTPSLTQVVDPAPAIRLLDYNLEDDEMLAPNIGIIPPKLTATDTALSTANPFWTHDSMARVGYIVPNTSTYLVVGRHKGLTSDIAYKIARRVDVGGDSIIHLQTEADYDNTGNNGTWNPGTGYSVDDDITLIVSGSDGHIYVKAVDGVTGAVTAFEVDGERIGGLLPGVELNVTSVSPAGGSGFSLTPGTDNLGDANGGYAPTDPDDIMWYYWLYDVNDMVDVKNGVVDPWDPDPYEKGVFPIPYGFDIDSGNGDVEYSDFTPYAWNGGGFYDWETELFYIAMSRYDTGGLVEQVPIILGFKVVL